MTALEADWKYFPELYRKSIPVAIKKSMIPKREIQTMHPARHLRRNIKMKAMIMEAPAAASKYCQF